MNKVLILSALLTFLLPSCKKSEGHSERYNNLLGTWLLVEVGKDSNMNMVIEQTELRPAPIDPSFKYLYENDNNGKYYFTIAGGGTVTNYRWYLNNNDNTLRIVFNEGTSVENSSDEDIVSLSKDILIIRYYYSTDTGYNVYKKQ